MNQLEKQVLDRIHTLMLTKDFFETVGGKESRQAREMMVNALKDIPGADKTMDALYTFIEGIQKLQYHISKDGPGARDIHEDENFIMAHVNGPGILISIKNERSNSRPFKVSITKWLAARQRAAQPESENIQGTEND